MRLEPSKPMCVEAFAEYPPLGRCSLNIFGQSYKLFAKVRREGHEADGGRGRHQGHHPQGDHGGQDQGCREGVEEEVNI